VPSWEAAVGTAPSKHRGAGYPWRPAKALLIEGTAIGNTHLTRLCCLPCSRLAVAKL